MAWRLRRAQQADLSRYSAMRSKAVPQRSNRVSKFSDRRVGGWLGGTPHWPDVLILQAATCRSGAIDDGFRGVNLRECYAPGAC